MQYIVVKSEMLFERVNWRELKAFSSDHNGVQSVPLSEIVILISNGNYEHTEIWRQTLNRSDTNAVRDFFVPLPLSGP